MFPCREATNAIKTSSGTATIVMGPSSSNWLDPQTAGEVVTIETGITIQGGYGAIGGNSTLINRGNIVSTTLSTSGTNNKLLVHFGVNGMNQGTIQGGSPNDTLYPTQQVGLQVDQGGSGAGWTNTGTIATVGGVLRIGASNAAAEAWTNSGTITTAKSTLTLGGLFTQAALKSFTRDAASTVNLDGTLTGDLTLNDNLGPWNLTGNAVLQNGTFAIARAARRPHNSMP